MNTPVKFKRMQELAAELSDRLDKLESGQLTKSQLEDLTEHSRELYERLVVLRFKAYDNEVKPNEPSTSEKENDHHVGAETPISEQPSLEAKPSFRISVPTEITPSAAAEKGPALEEKLEEIKEVEIDSRQVSLIDAIEEVSKSEDHSTQSIQETIAQAQRNNGPSLHDRLSAQVGTSESIGERMVHTPIADLKKAITLNQRFQFSRELFKGNNQDYEMAIDKLNTANREEALKHLDSLRNRYTWNNEDSVTHDFVELVTRRHQ